MHSHTAFLHLVPACMGCKCTQMNFLWSAWGGCDTQNNTQYSVRLHPRNGGADCPWVHCTDLPHEDAVAGCNVIEGDAHHQLGTPSLHGTPLSPAPKTLKPQTLNPTHTCLMKMLSLVAMSLKGMPTTSLAPSLRYSCSGWDSSDSATALNTVPSLHKRKMGGSRSASGFDQVSV
jgi:hypothetical protein